MALTGCRRRRTELRSQPSAIAGTTQPAAAAPGSPPRRPRSSRTGPVAADPYVEPGEAGERRTARRRRRTATRPGPARSTAGQRLTASAITAATRERQSPDVRDGAGPHAVSRRTHRHYAPSAICADRIRRRRMCTPVATPTQRGTGTDPIGARLRLRLHLVGLTPRFLAASHLPSVHVGSSSMVGPGPPSRLIAGHLLVGACRRVVRRSGRSAPCPVMHPCSPPVGRGCVVGSVQPQLLPSRSGHHPLPLMGRAPFWVAVGRGSAPVAAIIGRLRSSGAWVQRQVRPGSSRAGRATSHANTPLSSGREEARRRTGTSPPRTDNQRRFTPVRRYTAVGRNSS